MSDRSIRTVQIVNRKGLHARASAQLATLAGTLSTPVTVEYNGAYANARSIMDLLCLGAGFGAHLTVSAQGKAAETALNQVSALIESGFGELPDDQKNK